MKTASTAIQNHLQGDCTTLARLYKITRKDGTVLTFTDHDQDISTVNYQCYFDDGGYVYEAAVGFSPTATDSKSDLSLDNQQATAFIDSVTIKENELRYGIWDAAEVKIYIVNWADLTQGPIKQRKGQIGNISMQNGVLTADVLGLTNLLQILIGRTFGAPCDAELGDSRCQATVPVESGSVNTSPSIGVNAPHAITPNSGLTGAAGHYTAASAGTFTVKNASGHTTTQPNTGAGNVPASGCTMIITAAVIVGNQTTYTFQLIAGPPPAAHDVVTISGMLTSGNNGTFTISLVVGNGFDVWVAGYYDDGIVTFTSGPNSGLSFQIGTWDGITLTLKNPLFAPCTNGDTFNISPGCAHNVNDCFNKFNNLDNHRGFPTMPGQDSILNYATGV